MRGRHLLCSAAIVLLAGGAGADTALIRVPGIQGDGKVEGFEDWITVSGYVAAPRPDRSQHHELAVSRSGALPDQISVALSNLATSGDSFALDYTWLETREDASPIQRMDLRFTDCQVVRIYLPSGKPPGPESITFSCVDGEVITGGR